MSARRELAAAAVLCAAGAALVLLAAGRPWVRAVVDLPAPLPPARYVLTGRELAPQPTGLGLAGLAGLAGLVASRRAARAVVGLLLALMGTGVVFFSVAAVRAGYVLDEVAARASVAGAGSAATTNTTPWWLASAAGGVLLLAAGALTTARGRRWPGMSGRYDRPGARQPPGRPPASERPGSDRRSDQWGVSAMWDSLDRGTDPTSDPVVGSTVDPDAGRGDNTRKGT